MNDRTALSFWHPRLVAAGLPVPRTILLAMPERAAQAVWKAFDSKDGEPQENEALVAFSGSLKVAGDAIGWPCFLRTDHTSGKHDWKRTCFVPTRDDMLSHMFAICEFSEIDGMFGELPWRDWAVREMLPTQPVGVCSGYGDMPICREFRFFVQGGVVLCQHPYWPIGALQQGNASEIDYDALCEIPDGLDKLAAAAGRAVGGFWSVDLLETSRGWYITDMAEGEKSFHWPDCAAAEAPRDGP